MQYSECRIIWQIKEKCVQMRKFSEIFRIYPNKNITFAAKTENKYDRTTAFNKQE